MQISTSLLPDSRDRRDIHIAVVIDVLRATSVMATALQAGAAKIITCREVQEAVRLANSCEPRPLLAGERECKPIDGFDLGNSPLEYQPEVVGQRALVMTTTNGTRAIDAVAKVDRVITACFLNLSAVVTRLGGAKRVHLVCAGTNGQLTAEDVSLAGAIIQRCQTEYEATLVDDDSVVALALWNSWCLTGGQTVLPTTTQLGAKLRETQGGRNLVVAGYAADLDRCAAIDSAPVVPTRIGHDPPAFIAVA
jgi:2-phosphosulfolactate phosphatase